MSENTQNSPNVMFMQNNPNGIDVTPEGAALLIEFKKSHQRILDSPEPGQKNRDGVSILADDGRVVSVIMQRGEDGPYFRVATSSLAELHADLEPKVEILPYGLQFRDGYMRVETDLGSLKYDTYGREATVDADDPVPVVTIASLLEVRAKSDETSVVSMNPETEDGQSQNRTRGIGKVIMRHLRSR